MMLENIFPLATLLIIFICPVYIAALILHRYYPACNISARLAAYGVIAHAFVVIVFHLLAYTGLFYREVVLFVCLAASILARVLLPVSQPLRKDLIPIKNWFGWLIQSRKRLVVFLLSLVVVLISAARALLMPPLAWDSLTYHLFVAASWVQQGALTSQTLPPPTASYIYFPLNGEVVAAWFLLPFHGDLFVNFMNFPFLFAGAFAVYALAREFGLDREWSLLTVALISFSPMIYSELTTAYVEVILYAEVLSAALFFYIYCRKRRIQDAVLMLLGMGLVLGTKLTSALWILLAGIPFLIVFFSELRKCENKFQEIKPVLIVLPVVLVVACTWYFRNYIQTRNPIYPFGLSFAGKEFLPMSVYKQDVIKKLGPGSFRQDVRAFVNLFRFTPPRPYVINAGPKYLVFILIALIFCFRPLKHCSSVEYWFLLLWGLLPIAITFLSTSSDMVASRRWWPNANARFLSPQFVFLAIAAALRMESIGNSHRIKWLLCGLLTVDVYHLNLTFLHRFWGALTTIALLCLIWIGIRLVSSVASRGPVDKFSLFLVTVFLMSTAAYLGVVREYRTATRVEYFQKYSDFSIHETQFAEGWGRLDQKGKSWNIVLYAGETFSGHNWYFYPLMGHDLQNKVFYVPVGANGFSVENEKNRQDLIKDWIGRLRDQRIDFVFIQKPWPEELSLIAESGNLFEKTLEKEDFQIYKTKFLSSP